MINDFEERLKGGHPNSLGNTIEVVDEVLAYNSKLKDLFDCYQSDDEVVRLRVSNGIKRICTADKKLILPYINTLLNDVSKIDQASAKWTLSQLFLMLFEDMDKKQKAAAINIMKDNLLQSSDWIVLAQTMNTLMLIDTQDYNTDRWLKPRIEELIDDKRKAVSKKATKAFEKLYL